LNCVCGLNILGSGLGFDMGCEGGEDAQNYCFKTLEVDLFFEKFLAVFILLLRRIKRGQNLLKSVNIFIKFI